MRNHYLAGRVVGLIKFNLFYRSAGGKSFARLSSLDVQKKKKKMKAAYLVVVMGAFIGNAGAEEPPPSAATAPPEQSGPRAKILALTWIG